MAGFFSGLHRAGWLVAGIFFSTSLPAAMVHLPGTTVDFFYEDTQPGMSVYGTLTAVGDSIFATPTGFFAEAVNGSMDSLSVLGTVSVVAKAGFSFESVQVAQQGDYALTGSGASVSIVSTLDVTDKNNAATTISTPLTSSSDFTLQGAANPWSNSVPVDLSTSPWNGVTSIDLTLDTLLGATTTSNGESAKIENKFTGGGLVTIMTTPGITTPTVPIPAGFWLFVSGLALLYRKGRIPSKS